jgi:hypothetical protein
MPYDWRADTRKQILKTARLKNAADSDDFYRWIYALVWFHPGGDHLPWTLTDIARGLGRDGFVEADAVKMIEEARQAPKKMRADRLADWLGVTFAERQVLGLTRIGSTNVRKRARYELRKRRKKMKERERRQKNGARPRVESIEHRRPWAEEGIRRSQWYARRKKHYEMRSSELDWTDSWTATLLVPKHETVQSIPGRLKLPSSINLLLAVSSVSCPRMRHRWR